MAELHRMQLQALEYIRNAGGKPKIEWFDDDHWPIGPQMRSDLKKLSMVEEHLVPDEGLGASTITLTSLGEGALAVRARG